MVIAGKYRLLRRIGGGAMGVVWAALNELTAREVALKFIVSPDPGLRRRLQREARACGALRHRNVVDVYDLVQADNGDPVLVLQLLQGETLADLLKRRRRLEPPLAALIARDIAVALAAVHDLGIVHRDLKPANIFLHEENDGESPVVKVLDFGVMKRISGAPTLGTAPGHAVGSIAYMSPEQIRASSKVDPRADLWSLGVVLFEMLTGHRPFQGDLHTTLMQILQGEIPRVSRFVRSVDPTLVDLVDGLLRRERDERLGPAEAIASALSAHVGYGDPWWMTSPVAPSTPQPAPQPASPIGGQLAAQIVADLAADIAVQRAPQPAAPPPVERPAPEDDDITQPFHASMMVHPAMLAPRPPAQLREKLPQLNENEDEVDTLVFQRAMLAAVARQAQPAAFAAKATLPLGPQPAPAAPAWSPPSTTQPLTAAPPPSPAPPASAAAPASAAPPTSTPVPVSDAVPATPAAAAAPEGAPASSRPLTPQVLGSPRRRKAIIAAAAALHVAGAAMIALLPAMLSQPRPAMARAAIRELATARVTEPAPTPPPPEAVATPEAAVPEAAAPEAAVPDEKAGSEQATTQKSAPSEPAPRGATASSRSPGATPQQASGSKAGAASAAAAAPGGRCARARFIERKNCQKTRSSRP